MGYLQAHTPQVPHTTKLVMYYLNYQALILNNRQNISSSQGTMLSSGHLRLLGLCWRHMQALRSCVTTVRNKLFENSGMKHFIKISHIVEIYNIVKEINVILKALYS